MNQPNSAADGFSRRRFLAASAGTALAWPAADAAALDTDASLPPHQATGVKVGEITENSAIIWTRLTAHPTRNNDGVVIPKQRDKEPRIKVTVDAAEIEGACPGAAGRLRVRYGLQPDLADAQETEWADVAADTDFTRQFALSNLKPATKYHFAVETTGPGGAPRHGAFRGRFETAPTPEMPSDFRFCVMTCQGYPDRDHADGHPIYPSMLALEPKFVSFTGDVVYYDNDSPRATTPALARLHWERMFSLPRQVELLRNVAGYWLKDDHDTLENDTWPGRRAGQLTFAEGQQIFREQTPLGDPGYRTFRWGRDLQIWLTDGRDFRSPNGMDDGPDKTIWGAEQKAWFKDTVAASDAAWKVLISPTPFVGPDKPKKKDNHSNPGFAHEGKEIREWIRDHVPDNLFIVCGDRHWQYHSVHPDTGTQEFSVGAASDSHSGGSPGENPAFHKFHRPKGGGFLSVTLRREAGESVILFEHRDVHGAVVYQWQARRAV